MLKPDQQTDSCSESACSADVSVTDSGKGPSEEGEQLGGFQHVACTVALASRMNSIP